MKNESEVFFFNLNKSDGINKKNLDNLFLNKELTNSYYEQVSLDELPFPDWESYIKNYPLRNNFFGLKLFCKKKIIIGAIKIKPKVGLLINVKTEISKILLKFISFILLFKRQDIK